MKACKIGSGFQTERGAETIIKSSLFTCKNTGSACAQNGGSGGLGALAVSGSLPRTPSAHLTLRCSHSIPSPSSSLPIATPCAGREQHRRSSPPASSFLSFGFVRLSSPVLIHPPAKTRQQRHPLLQLGRQLATATSDPSATITTTVGFCAVSHFIARQLKTPFDPSLDSICSLCFGIHQHSD